MAVHVLWSEAGREESRGTRCATSLWAVIHADGDESDGTERAIAAVLVEVFQTARHYLHGAAGTDVWPRRRAVAWCQDGLMWSSRAWSPSHGAQVAAGVPRSPRTPHEGRVVLVAHSAPIAPVFLPRERGER